MIRQVIQILLSALLFSGGLRAQETLKQDRKTAYEYFQMAQHVEDDTLKIAFYFRAIQYYITFDTAHYNLGTVFLEMNDYMRAEKRFQTAILINPDNCTNCLI